MQDPATRIHMLEVGSLVGEYRIEKLVGQGGMGQVYGAVHPLIGKRAAIKVLRGELCSDAEAIERFVLEARAVNQIGHPNIVDVFAFGALPDGRQYMVMEWLRGESLDERIRRLLPTLEEACDILLGICAALDAAHAEQIIHRDLKPHNVFLSHARGMKPTVKLLDFGLVKLVGNDGDRVERTRSGSMLGTPAYMSPEQARGRGVDHRTDLYALGVMMFELVTGTLPFLEESAMEMVVAHLQRPAPAPSSYRPDLPRVLDDLVLGLLAKEPAHRPAIADVIASVTEVQRQLAAMPARTPAMNATLIAASPPRSAMPPSVPGAAASPPSVTPVPLHQVTAVSGVGANVLAAAPDAATMRPFLNPGVPSGPANLAANPRASVLAATPDAATIRPFPHSAANLPPAPVTAAPDPTPFGSAVLAASVSPTPFGSAVLNASVPPAPTPIVSASSPGIPAPTPFTSAVHSSSVSASPRPPSVALGSSTGAPLDASTAAPLVASGITPVVDQRALATAVIPARRGGRRVVLALLAAIVVAGIAFGLVFALRGGESTVAVDAAIATPVAVPDAALVATPSDAGVVASPLDATIAPEVIDAAVAAIRDATPETKRDAGTTGRKPPKSRDAGVASPPISTPDAGVAPTPDSAVKPLDDGDGLLPTKPGGSR
jgi:serine/threonine protein kinase